MNFKNKSIEELVELISPNSAIHQELRKRGVLRTKNTTGELGEYYVKNYYDKTPSLPNLLLPPPGVKNIDVLSREGERYSIKTVTNPRGTTGSFWNPESIRKNEKIFEYLLIVILSNSYSLDLILKLSWEQFFKYKSYNKRMNNFNISISKKLTESVEVIYDKNKNNFLK